MTNPWRVFIGNLNFQTDEDELFQFLNGYADVKSVAIVRHQDGTSRGFGFAEARSEDDLAVLLQLNGAGLRGRNLFVERCRPKVKMGVAVDG